MFDLYDVKVAVNTVAFSPDGTLLAAGCYRGHVQLWEAATGTLRGRLPGCRFSVPAVFFSPDGQALYGVEQGLLAWQVQPPAQKPRTVVAGHGMVAAALSNDGQRLCVCGFLPNQPTLVVYRCPEVRMLWSVVFPDRNGPATLALTRDGRTVATGSHKGSVVVRDAETGAVRQELPPAAVGVKALAFSPDGAALACAAKGHLYLWQLDPLREIAHHTTGRTHFLGVAFHPSGEFFATANGDGKVDYWDAATGKHRESFDWKVGKLHDVTFAPDGQRAACCAKSGHIILWDVDV
jgi:WD40 repeat protein